MGVWAMLDMAMALDSTVDTMAMDMVMALDTLDTAMVDTMARGLLMLSPRLMLIPTMAMDMVWDIVDTTGDKSSHQQGYLDIHQDLSVNHQLLCQQKNGLFQFECHPPPVLPVSVLPA